MKKRSFAQATTMMDGQDISIASNHDLNDNHTKKIKPSPSFSSINLSSSLVLSLNDLPMEMIGIILSFLDWKEIMIGMSLVSRRMFEQSTQTQPLHVRVRGDEAERFFGFNNHRYHPCIVSMEIYDCKGIGSAFGNFIKNSLMKNLTELTIRKCCWNDGDCGIFNRYWESFTNLKKLNVSRNVIGDEGCVMIFKSPLMANLELLDLSSNRGISNFPKKRFHLNPTKLTMLNLQNNYIQDYTYLFQNLSNLTCLKVNGNEMMNVETLKCIFTTCRKLTSLNTSHITNMTDELLHEILEDEKNCNNLTSLKLSKTVSNEGCLYLAHAQQLKNITKLSLDMNKITTTSCHVLSESIYLKQLISLSLFGNLIKDSGLESILRNFKELTYLNLGSNRISDSGIIYLINNGYNNLKHLNLYDNNFSRKVREEFFKKYIQADRGNFFFPCTANIDISTEHVEDVDDKELPLSGSDQEEIVPEIERLPVLVDIPPKKLDDMQVGDVLPIEIMYHIFTYLDWKTVINSVSKSSKFWADEMSRFPLRVDISTRKELLISPINCNGIPFHIQSLEMRNVFIPIFPCLKLTWISNQNILSKMVRMNLNSCQLDDLMCKRLCENITTNSLIELGLSRNHITDKGANIIFTLLNNRKMETLNLSHNRIRKIAPFGKNLVFNLKSLNLSHNKIVDIIGVCPGFTQLETLKLNGNDNISENCLLDVKKITTLTYLNLSSVKSFTVDPCIQYFSGATHANLTTLKISSNIGDGCCEIAMCNQLQNLRSLMLDLCNISDLGCSYIAGSAVFRKMTDLSLYGNHIQDEGLIAILESEPLKNLKVLNFGENQIGDESINFILERGVNNLEKFNILNIDCSKDLVCKVKSSKFKDVVTVSQRATEDVEDEDEDEDEDEENEEDEDEDMLYWRRNY